jgi:hypothetical protein
MPTNANAIHAEASFLSQCQCQSCHSPFRELVSMTLDFHHSSAGFMSLVLGIAAKACGLLDNEYSLVLHAWTRIDIALRETLDEPPEGATIEQFLERVRSKQTNWFEKAWRLTGQSKTSRAAFRHWRSHE